MGLKKNTTNLINSVSDKFSLSESEAILYLLALIQIKFSKRTKTESMDVTHYELATYATDFNELIDSDTLNRSLLNQIKDSYLSDLKSLNFHLFSKYLIGRYLELSRISLPSSALIDLITDLATESALELHSSDDYQEYIFTPFHSFSTVSPLSPYFPKNVNYKPGKNKEWCIYAANIGIGDVFVKLHKKLERERILEDCFFVGNEPNEVLNFFTDFNYFSNKILNNVQTNSENPIANNGLLSNSSIGLENDVQIAISIPPFFKIRQQDLEPLYNFTGINEKIHFSELAYIEMMLKRVSDRGKVIAVVSNSFLSSSLSKVFREKYIYSDLLEKVISLPSQAFNKTNIGISVIVLNKNKQEKGFVSFDGLEKGFEKTKIDNKEIISNNFDLRTNLYALKEGKEVRNIIANSNHLVKKIKHLCKIYRGIGYSSKDLLEEQKSELDLPFVRIRDLANSEEKYNLDTSKVEKFISRKKVSKVIDFDAILVSSMWSNLKPTKFKFNGKPIVIGSDIFALKVNDELIDADYLLSQLHSKIVQIQIKMMSSGTVINRINKKDFEHIQIILPSLEEQKRQILEVRGVIAEKTIAQEKIAKAEEQSEAIEYEVIANMNHSLKNKLGVIINDYDTLVRFLQRKERTKSVFSFDDTIRPVFEGENAADVDTIKLITERLKNNLLDTSKVFNTSLKLQTRELNKTLVELVSYFRNELKPLYSGQNFAIEVVAKPRLKLNTLIDKEVFKEVIDNLINNAKSHGFVEKDREYKVVFELLKSGEVYDERSETVRNYARILYKNDGKSFPKGFSFNDYVRYSSKAGKTQGTGIGGAVIDRIIKLHEGKFKEIPTGENSFFNVQFEILLPLDE